MAVERKTVPARKEGIVPEAVEQDLARLDRAVRQFCDWIESHPANCDTEQGWGPREVLAHLVYHHELYVKQAEARIRGENYQPIQGRYREINAAAVEMNQDESAPVLIERFQAANQQLETICRQYDAESIPMELKKGVRMRTLAGLLNEVEAHIRNHQQKLAVEDRKRRKQAL